MLCRSKSTDENGSQPVLILLLRPMICTWLLMFATMFVLGRMESKLQAQDPLVTSSGNLAGYKIRYIEEPDYIPGDPNTPGVWKINNRNHHVTNDGKIVGNVVWEGRNGQLMPPPGGTFPWHREAFVYDIATDDFQFVKDLVDIPQNLIDYYPELYFKSFNNTNLFVGMLRRADGINPAESIPILIDLNDPFSFELLPTPDEAWIEDRTVPFSYAGPINDLGDVLIRFRSKSDSPNAAAFMWNYYTRPDPELVVYPENHANAGQPIYFADPNELHEMNMIPQFVAINQESGETFRISFDSNLRSSLYETDQFADVVWIKNNGVNDSGSFTGRMNRLVVVPGKGKKTKTETRQVPFIYTDAGGMETLPTLGETWGMGHDLNDSHDVIGQLDDLERDDTSYEPYRRFFYHDGFESQPPALIFLEGDTVPASLNSNSEHLNFWNASDGKLSMHVGERIDLDSDGIGDYPIITGTAAVAITTTSGKGKNKTTTTTEEARWFVLEPILVPEN